MEAQINNQKHNVHRNCTSTLALCNNVQLISKLTVRTLNILPITVVNSSDILVLKTLQWLVLVAIIKILIQPSIITIQPQFKQDLLILRTA